VNSFLKLAPRRHLVVLRTMARQRSVLRFVCSSGVERADRGSSLNLVDSEHPGKVLVHISQSWRRYSSPTSGGAREHFHFLRWSPGGGKNSGAGGNRSQAPRFGVLTSTTIAKISAVRYWWGWVSWFIFCWALSRMSLRRCSFSAVSFDSSSMAFFASCSARSFSPAAR
jgi:hypothetical protein